MSLHQLISQAVCDAFELIIVVAHSSQKHEHVSKEALRHGSSPSHACRDVAADSSIVLTNKATPEPGLFQYACCWCPHARHQVKHSDCSSTGACWCVKLCCKGRSKTNGTAVPAPDNQAYTSQQYQHQQLGYCTSKLAHKPKAAHKLPLSRAWLRPNTEYNSCFQSYRRTSGSP